MYSSASVVLKLLPYVVGALAAIGPTANLVITNKNISPDGFTRSAVLAGAEQDSATFPGPLITANKGDNFNLNVVNSLTDNTMLLSTSIHWHGMFQQGTSWSDGPVGVTQCPIIPGESYLYQFSSTTQAGTFWYHSHYSTQYCDGLRGALVVYDPQDPHLPLYDIDDESTVITLADWYHTPAPTAMVRGIPPTPAGTLINGLGRFFNGPTDAPLSVINVVGNKRYRFRLVSISCSPNFKFSIEGHNMTIIEVDTVNVQPLTVDSIQIFAGQRYSFVLNTNQPYGNYWIRAQPNQGNTNFTGGINSAILRYAGANMTQDPPDRNITLTNPMLETNLHPLENPGAPGIPGAGNADVNLQLNIGRNGDNRFTVNNVTFDPTNQLYDLPVLLQIMSGAASVQDLIPQGSYYELPPNSVIELTIPGGTAGNFHPIHLHGHVFDVVRSAGSSVYNYDNPVRRDVVNIGSGGDMTTIRFKTDNAGPWILHCHIDWHLELGFAVVFVEDFGGIKHSSQPPSWDNLCPAFRALPKQTFPATA